MDLTWQIKLIILFIFIFLSSFFSGSEVALFSLDRKKLRNSLLKNPLILRYLTDLLDHPRRLLITILLGNTIVNVAASIIAVTLALEVFSDTSLSKDFILTIQIIVLTVVIILFGELLPKVLASRFPFSVSKAVAVPLYFLSVLVYPVAEFITEAIRLITSKIKLDKRKSAILPDEIPELADLGHERGTIEESEHELIHGIVSFKSVAVHEIMTPRVDIVALPSDTTFDNLLSIITSSGHSRLPLYEDDLDEIIGIIYAKDLLPYIKDKELRIQFNMKKLVRKPIFVPGSKMINSMMYEFQEKKMHIAIVVDEFGGTAGLVTLEDIIEEIIGEIRDEYDKDNIANRINENSFLVLGKISVDELNELLNTNISSEKGEFETLGGLILNHAGQIPKEDYSFQLENYKFTVKEVSKRRINKVLIEKISGE
ncbi:MAG: hemolysin family protein [Ignavibacteria bacterium]